MKTDMHIRWENVFCFALLIVGLVICVKGCGSMRSAASDMERIGPGHSIDEKTTGLLCIGLLGVTLVAIVKILTKTRD